MQQPDVSLKERFRTLIDACPTQEPCIPSALSSVPVVQTAAAAMPPSKNKSPCVSSSSAIDHKVDTTVPTSSPVDFKIVLIATLIVVSLGICLYCMIPKTDLRDGVDDDEFEDAMADFRKQVQGSVPANKRKVAKQKPVVQVEDEDEPEYEEDDEDEYERPPIPTPKPRAKKPSQQASITAARAHLTRGSPSAKPTRQPPGNGNDGKSRGDPMFQPL